MKKIFPLKVPGKVDRRVVDAVKNDVRKYVKRERRKPLPEGFSEWKFACKAGPDRATAPDRELADVYTTIDTVANADGAEIYVEILAVPGHRPPPPQVPLTPLTPQLPPVEP